MPGKHPLKGTAASASADLGAEATLGTVQAVISISKYVSGIDRGFISW
jgi:hypothetical protein